MIRDDKMHQAQSLFETAVQDGMLSMDRSLRALVDAGVVALDEAKRFARQPAKLSGDPAARSHLGFRR